MEITDQQIKSAIECINNSIKLIEQGKSEDVIRHNFTSYLRAIYPEVPKWVERHIEGSESAVKFEKAGEIRTGFVDNLVDLTVIEYESDLRSTDKFNTGYNQVKDYCASLLNKGYDQDHVIGILSDTVRWRVYKIKTVESFENKTLGGRHIELIEIENLDLGEADEIAAKKLITLLNTYLGRIGSRPLDAESIAKDLGFESKFCLQHIQALNDLVNNAFTTRPQYANLIAKLWTQFVSYVRDETSESDFDWKDYTDELYIMTLAKLVCANIIESKALMSDDAELISILNGDYFKSKGLSNLVEYDYFGWLNDGEYVVKLLPIARKIQDDLTAYDYSSIPSEDLFGQMMAQLAKRSQRLLLGQEWTPKWLANKIVNNVITKIPKESQPMLVDMCCGSGAMIVEAVQLSKNRINEIMEKEPQERKIQALSQAITGFDIDPLAVILSKISWVLAARDWLEPFGTYTVTIPIYHADSLFAITPLSDNVQNDEDELSYELKIEEQRIKLPRFLITPEFQSFFDTILDFGYDVATSVAEDTILQLSEDVIDEAIQNALYNLTLTKDMLESTKKFLREFIFIVNKLNKEGRNGIWAFILRNSYRPGLVAGKFNGLVSNPPWLALSKIGENPYRNVLKQKAEEFNINPPGPSFLHIEMATIFLLHAIDRYLSPGAKIGCIIPETLLNGYHHNPFRKAEYTNAKRSVHFSVEEIWRVQEDTFKNKAIVLFGTKQYGKPNSPDPIPGAFAQETGLSRLEFNRIIQGNRTAWSERSQPSSGSGFFTPAKFKQGADIMPRTLFFHDLEAVSSVGNRRQWRVKPIEISGSPLSFAIKDAKKYKDFRLRPCILPDDLFFDVLTSNLLTPFDLNEPIKALLPIKKGKKGTWEPLSMPAIKAKGRIIDIAFKQICMAISPNADLNTIWNLINKRNKLSQQIIKPGGFLVVTGTSGGIVCSAYMSTDYFDLEKLIIDQTLNWAQVESEDEAIYLVGLFNSLAINQVIQDFVPQGRFGGRHIHSLPFGVTPPYDPTQVAHEDVVEKTRELLLQYEKLKETEPEFMNLLDPNSGSLAQRRSKIREKLEQLTAYKEYEMACKNLYGVR